MISRNRRGNQAVEFALVLPVLMILVAGTIDFGWYLHLKHDLVNAMGQAARAGAAGDELSDAERVAMARTVAADIWSSAGGEGELVLEVSTTGASPTANIIVTGTIDFDSVRLIGYIPAPATIEHTAAMWIEDLSGAAI